MTNNIIRQKFFIWSGLSKQNVVIVVLQKRLALFVATQIIMVKAMDEKSLPLSLESLSSKRSQALSFGFENLKFIDL